MEEVAYHSSCAALTFAHLFLLNPHLLATGYNNKPRTYAVHVDPPADT